jgi:hypothetical protein
MKTMTTIQPEQARDTIGRFATQPNTPPELAISEYDMDSEPATYEDYLSNTDSTPAEFDINDFHDVHQDEFESDEEREAREAETIDEYFAGTEPEFATNFAADTPGFFDEDTTPF